MNDLPIRFAKGMQLLKYLMNIGGVRATFRFKNLVGVRRFELRASWSQTKRSDLTELHPGAIGF